MIAGVDALLARLCPGQLTASAARARRFIHRARQGENDETADSQDAPGLIRAEGHVLPLGPIPGARSVTVDLVEDGVVPDASEGGITVFVRTPTTRRSVDFVLAALRKDAAFAGPLGDLGRGVGLRITERKSSFRVDPGGRGFTLAATVDRGTGALLRSPARVHRAALEAHCPPVEEADPPGSGGAASATWAGRAA